MTRLALLSSLLLLALSATATAGPSTAPVVGGTDAPAGKYPDVAGVVLDGQVACTGTLIAPDVVITAGHCNDATLTQVIIGSISRSNVGDGEVIPVAERIEYLNSWESFDVTVLRLAQPSTKAPRTIASGWARFDIADGADAALVGFGAIDVNGYEYVDALQEAMTTITDADCSSSAGCNAGAQPAGELGAGGNGIDTCFGDSGGPLYLVTDYGMFLAGVTSRAYSDATTPCSEGGIYARPDAIIDWIETETGVDLPVGPVPTADVLVAPGGSGSVQIVTNDPHADRQHTYVVTVPPEHGTAEVQGDGTVEYRGESGYLGTDRLEVEVIDANDPDRKLAVVVDVEVVEDTGGCCSTSGGRSGSALLAFAVLGLVLRRRR